MEVDVPEGVSGDVEVYRFEVVKNSIEYLRLMFSPAGGREPEPGWYTGMARYNRLWMSDTTAERRDHLSAAWEIDMRGGRILMSGLGLGMLLRVALHTESVTHVDVVELDSDVVKLVSPHYQEMADLMGKSLTIYEDDIFKIRWPRNTRWDVAWFDVWSTICTDNLGEMAKLNRSYNRRTDWHGCWSQELLRSLRSQGL